jgi:hypothetical protein
MKRKTVVFCTVKNGSLTFSPADMKNPGFVYLWQDSYMLRFIELPPLPNSEIWDFVKYRFSKIYPGNNDDIVFDVLDRIRDSQGLNPVLLVSADLVKKIYARYPKTHIGSFYTSFINPLGDFGRIVVCNKKIETAIFKDNYWSRLQSFDIAEKPVDILVAEILQKDLCVQLIVDDKTYSQYKYLGSERCNILKYPSSLDMIFLRRPDSFKRKNSQKKFGKGISLVSCVSFVILINLIIIFNTLNISLRTTYYRSFIKNSVKMTELESRYTAMFYDISSIQSHQIYASIKPYRFLSALRRYNTTGSLSITSMNLTVNNFSLEAESENAIEILRSMSNSPYFTDLKLSNVQRLQNGAGERFSLVGVFHDKP